MDIEDMSEEVEEMLDQVEDDFTTEEAIDFLVELRQSLDARLKALKGIDVANAADPDDEEDLDEDEEDLDDEV